MTERFDADFVGRILRTCTTEHDWSHPPASLDRLVAGRDLTGLVSQAVIHGVASMVYLSIRNIEGVDPSTIKALGVLYARAASIHMRALADLASLGKVLDSSGIPWITFKGPILTEIVYPRSDLRSYVDLDILIPQEAFREAVESLERSGSDLIDRNWTLIRDDQRGQLHVGLPAGTMADVHWHLLNRAAVRRSLAISIEGLFERARTVSIQGMRVRTLDPVDTALHVCVHGALDGGARLRALKDVEFALRAAGEPWDELVARAREWRASSLVAVMLQRTRTTLGVEVPDRVFRDLGTSRMRSALNAAVDRRWPPERAAGEYSFSVRWTQLSRDSLVATFAATAARLRSRRINRAARVEDKTAAISQHSGDESTRKEYFEQVTKPDARDEASP